MDHFSVVGRTITRAEGPDKVSGKAAYAADEVLPGIIWGKAVRSALPHAKILRVDTSKAKAHSGVLAVVTADDMPDVLIGRHLQDTPVLARERVRFIGEKIAVVGAETREIAEEAAALVDVDYEELPAVFDPVEAVQEGTPVLHPNLAWYVNVPRPISKLPNVHSHVQWQTGDCENGFAASDFMFEQSFATQRTHQGYIEPHAAVVSIDGQDRIIVWSSNKFLF